MRALVLGALLLVGCGDDLLPGWEMPRGPNQTTESYCTAEANRLQTVDQATASGNWDAIYSRCLARFIGIATTADGGTQD